MNSTFYEFINIKLLIKEDIMGKKILVVDDDPDLVETTSIILKSKKFVLEHERAA